MATSQDAAKDKADDLQAQVEKLRAELADVTAQFRDGVVPSAKTAARAAGRAAVDSAHEVRDRARAYGEATVDSAKEHVRSNPLTAVGLSFALGALIALIMRR